MALSFDELILGRIDEVRQRLLQQEVLLIRGGPQDRFERLFNWEGVEGVLGSSRHSARDFSMFLGGKSLDLRFLRVFGDDGAFREAQFRSLTQQGVTLGGAQLERTLPQIAALALEAREIFGAVVRSAFVASYGTVTGYPVHYDCDDLIICQASGRKRWEFFGSPVAGSAYPFRDDGPPGELRQTVDLSPGDVLIVPSGLRHRCTPLEPSLHFGLALTWPTGIWIARRVMESAVGSVAAREPIRSFASAEARAALERVIREELTKVLGNLDFPDACSEFPVRFPLDGPTPGRDP